MEIGAQLYTVREHMKTLPELAETLKKVADIGYRTVQVSAACDFEPGWMKEELRKNGLRCVITHTPADRLLREPEKVAAEHEIFGCDCVGLGFYDIFSEGMDSFCEKFLPVARAVKASGKRFMYHNHDQEFRKLQGSLILEQLLQRFTPEEMGITFDTYWAQAGGADPVEWLYRLQGRTPCIHLKDMAYGQRMAVIGEGNMNFKGILKAASDTGVSYALVEQDDCGGEDPFLCLRRSYEYLKAMGLS